MRVAVVGAGLGGLAAALRLQGAGYEVVVAEQRPRPGGRAYRLTDGGFTWDMGPSLITMPWVLEETFAAGGLDLHHEVALRRLDPLYRIRWDPALRGAGGTDEDPHLDFTGDRERLRAEVARFSARDAARLDGFLDALRPIYEEAILGAGRRPFLTPGSFAALVPRMTRLRAVLPLHRFVARHFSHPRVREAFSFHSLFIGGDPFRVPAIYAALVYLQVLDGGWYADGGLGSVVDAMARPLDVRCGDGVERIEHRGGRVTGVRLRSGERIGADVVVSNADVLRTHELLGRRAPLRRPRETMSCFLLYLGTDRTFPRLGHHTLLVGRDYREFIRGVTRGTALPTTFSTYVHAPARTEPAMAAGGGDSLCVLLPVPNLRADIDWAREGDGLRDALVADLEATFGLRGLGAAVRVEHRMTPVDFARELGAAFGNAFATEPTLHQSAYFRTHNRDRRVEGLYHVGGGTHPGAGIPGVLLGAEVTAGLVAAAHPARRRSRAGAAR
jgi:phytoene desaturase